MPGVLLLHAWWGLNDDVRAYARRLRDEGFTVETPDLFAGKVADTIAGAEALRDAIERDDASIDRSRAIVDRAAGALAVPFGVVAFSLGVYYAWELAARRPDTVSALVSYYGTGSAEAGLPPMLGHYAEVDQFDSRSDVEALMATLGQKGVAVTTHFYAGARHWFAEPSRPEYDRAAAELAWRRTIEFLGMNVR